MSSALRSFTIVSIVQLSLGQIFPAPDCPNNLPGFEDRSAPQAGETFQRTFFGDDAALICGSSQCTCDFQYGGQSQCTTGDLDGNGPCKTCLKVIGGPCKLDKITTNQLNRVYFDANAAGDEACIQSGGSKNKKPNDVTACIGIIELEPTSCPGDTTDGVRVPAAGIPDDGESVSFTTQITFSNGENVDCDINIDGGASDLEVQSKCPIDLLNDEDVFDTPCEPLNGVEGGTCKSSVAFLGSPVTFDRANLNNGLAVCFSTVKAVNETISETLTPATYSPDRRYQAFLQRFEALCNEFPSECDTCRTCFRSKPFEVQFYTEGSLRFSGYGVRQNTNQMHLIPDLETSLENGAFRTAFLLRVLIKIRCVLTFTHSCREATNRSMGVATRFTTMRYDIR